VVFYFLVRSNLSIEMIRKAKALLVKKYGSSPKELAMIEGSKGK